MDSARSDSDRPVAPIATTPIPAAEAIASLERALLVRGARSALALRTLPEALTELSSLTTFAASIIRTPVSGFG
jgi:hypothetical protein